MNKESLWYSQDFNSTTIHMLNLPFVQPKDMVLQKRKQYYVESNNEIVNVCKDLKEKIYFQCL